jgi:hypothetical protein
MVASFGLSSSLRKKITRIQKKKKDQGNSATRCEYTYESSNSNISRSEPVTAICSGGTSFGLDVPEEVKSSVRFRFFSAP